jgi:hypothetical protein
MYTYKVYYRSEEWFVDGHEAGEWVFVSEFKDLFDALKAVAYIMDEGKRHWRIESDQS